MKPADHNNNNKQRKQYSRTIAGKSKREKEKGRKRDRWESSAVIAALK